MTSNGFSANQNRQKVAAAAPAEMKRYSTPIQDRIKVDPYNTPTVILEKKIQRESRDEVNKIV